MSVGGQPAEVLEKLQRLCEKNRVEINVLGGSGKVYLWVIPHGFPKGYHVVADTLSQALDSALSDNLSKVGENHPSKDF